MAYITNGIRCSKCGKSYNGCRNDYGPDLCLDCYKLEEDKKYQEFTKQFIKITILQDGATLAGGWDIDKIIKYLYDLEKLIPYNDRRLG